MESNRETENEMEWRMETGDTGVRHATQEKGERDRWREE